MNLNEHDFTVPKGFPVAKLTVLTLEQTKHLAPIDTNLCKFLDRRSPEQTENVINHLHQGPPEEYQEQKILVPYSKRKA